jgi:hypothetical protein|tara:strand:- start:526 stop:738 length:213 start_codon:yes stop_codon:yes gene_type:complete
MPINVKDKKGNIVAGPKKGNTMREAGKMKSRQGKMGGGMMMQRPGMKKGSIPPQLKKYVMAKKKKAAKKK